MSGNRKIFLFVALPLLIVFGLVAYYTLNKTDQTSETSSVNEPVVAQNDNCPTLLSPVDVTKVTSVLYPGQVRGGDYKPHGGFRVDNATDNLIDVLAPIDAKVALGSRYIEQGELQYLFEFENTCGLKYRFDHLKTLSTKLQAIADKLPEAKVDDSRTTTIREDISVKAGEIVATAVGFEKSPDNSTRPNVAFDFGLYDTRKKNESSQDPSWVTAHSEDGDQAIYAVCWLDWLPDADAATLKTLPGADAQSGKMSDYCK